MIGGAQFNIPVESIWRTDDDCLVRVVAHEPDGTVYVRHINGKGNTWGVNQAWFETWERTSTVEERKLRDRERCSKWIRGRQCSNFVMPGDKRCALHSQGVAAMREP